MNLYKRNVGFIGYKVEMVFMSLLRKISIGQDW